MAWHDMVGYGMAWHVMVGYGMAWHGRGMALHPHDRGRVWQGMAG